MATFVLSVSFVVAVISENDFVRRPSRLESREEERERSEIVAVFKFETWNDLHRGATCVPRSRDSSTDDRAMECIIYYMTEGGWRDPHASRDASGMRGPSGRIRMTRLWT